MPAPRCENCLLRFRTHRSLFKHLHVCIDHGQSPAPPPPPALDREPPVPERPPESDPAASLGLPFPLLEPFTSAPTGPFLPYLNPAPFGLSPPRLRPFVPATPGPPASGAAVWRKSQGGYRSRLPAARAERAPALNLNCLFPTGATSSPRRPQGGSGAPSGACR